MTTAILLAGIATITRPLQAGEPAAPTRVKHATDIVQAWKPGGHLFVKGDPGVAEVQLDALAVWLSQNATNWLVALVESAADERFTDAEGASFQGVEAVHQALGIDLLNRTAFGEQTDPRTGERNAAIFVLSLKDRRLSYFGSDAQDRRGLGEEQWIGNLDAPAIAAMRGGGRVVDAVKDTITNIDRRLGEKITTEIARREAEQARREAEQAQQQREAQAAIQTAGETLARLRSVTTDLRRGNPKQTGDLANPDLPGFETALTEARSVLALGDAPHATALAGGLKQRLEAHLESLTRHARDTAAFDEPGGRYQELAQLPLATVARDTLAAAADSLRAARESHARGESRYVADLTAATQSLNLARNQILAATRAAELRRNLRLAVGSGSVLLVVGVLFAMNRRRRAIKREAETQLRDWRTALGEKTAALFGLLDRRATVVGSSQAEAAARYHDDTLELARQVIADVDELFIMAACVDRVLRDAETALTPRILWTQLAHLFLRRPYQRALRLLRDEPIAFRPEEGLELVVRGPRTERDRLIGDLASYQPFTSSFNELIDAFNRHARAALDGLDRIESSVVEAGRLLGQLREGLDEIEAGRATLKAGDETNGWFAMPALFERLLPAAESSLAQARRRAGADPAGMLEHEGRLAGRQVGEARELLRIASVTRSERLPAAREAAATIEAAGLSATWIGEAFDRFSMQADDLATAAVDESVAGSLTELDHALTTLVATARRCGELGNERHTLLDQAIPEAVTSIAGTREALGQAVGRPPVAMLRETDADPDEQIRAASDQLSAAAPLLEKGNASAADAAIRGAREQLDRVIDILEASRQAAAAHEPNQAELTAEAARLEARLPAARTTLEGIRARYAPAVLLLGAGDPTHPEANGTTDDNLREAEEHLAAVQRLVQEAGADFREGRLLGTADKEATARLRLQLTSARLTEITEKQARITAADRTNAETLQQLALRREHARREVDRSTTMPATQTRCGEVDAALGEVTQRIEVEGRDPFQLADELASLGGAYDEVLHLAGADREHFQDSRNACASARNQVDEARRAAQAAIEDGLPDSAAITHCLGEVDRLLGELDRAEAGLNQPHQDWPRIEADARKIQGEAAEAAATLQGEVAAARQAAGTLQQAAQLVRQAALWSGGFGVSILGRPGGAVLTQAQDLLERGRYDEARAGAESAVRLANAAIAEAEAEVRRRRAAEEARQAAERRRRAVARQRAASSFSSGFGSSRPGSAFRSSGISRSSGMRSSGFSRSSGFKSSRW
ncbi:MAG: hypothetical protein H7A45_17180 [Verrucomicrobiales bacterium]|nr:hypothetical protein [Verrucomicrobiales bacterium]